MKASTAPFSPSSDPFVCRLTARSSIMSNTRLHTPTDRMA